MTTAPPDVPAAATGFNLSEWALRHKSFVVFLMLISALAGAYSYGKLGREEDPPFTIKTMVVKTLWPGATGSETVLQITDRIEKKLEEIPNLDYVRSYTQPGESVIFVNLKDSVRASDVPDLWYQVRKKVGDIRGNLPSGIAGPFFNDEFGDTYALIYAFTSDGFSPRELRDHVERLRAEVLRVPDVAKADLIGTQDEKIYLEFSTQLLASLALDANALAQTLQAECGDAKWCDRLGARTHRHPRLRRLHVRGEPEGDQLQAQQPAGSLERYRNGETWHR
jgi:multidrug efflux pump